MRMVNRLPLPLLLVEFEWDENIAVLIGRVAMPMECCKPLSLLRMGSTV